MLTFMDNANSSQNMNDACGCRARLATHLVHNANTALVYGVSNDQLMVDFGSGSWSALCYVILDE